MNRSAAKLSLLSLSVMVLLGASLFLWSVWPKGSLSWTDKPDEFQASAISSLKGILDLEPEDMGAIRDSCECEPEFEFITASVDLDNDGLDEVFIEVTERGSAFVCSIGGKCTTYILKTDGGNWSRVGDLFNATGITIKDEEENGFSILTYQSVTTEEKYACSYVGKAYACELFAP